MDDRLPPAAPLSFRHLRLIGVACLVATGLLHSQTADKDQWNKIFNDPKMQFNRQPSRFLIDAAKDRKPGEAIDLGMGEGRNAIYLAQRGWRVTGVDLSDVAVAQAKKRATELGVAIDAHIEDLDKFDLGRERWDLITAFYMHGWYHFSKLPTAKRLRDALRPGGLLVIEGFAGGQTGFQTNELLRDFAELRVLRYEDVQDEADWSPGRKSRIIRIVAEKAQ